MIAPKETTLTYRQATIRIVNQPHAVVAHWKSALDGSSGSLQLPRSNWADGEIARFVMENIDRCYNKHQQTQNQRQTE